MSSRFDTEQEAFWAGEFGDQYSARNAGDALIASNIAFFSNILDRCTGANSLIEFGANTGMNLRAIRELCPAMTLDAIEINKSAVSELEQWGGAQTIHHGSILDFKADRAWDIALIKGVLIHINPEFLPQVYQSLFGASRRYIVLAEYYNPTPVEVPYRGHSGKLFKRDFAGEMLEKYPNLRVVDYGFRWHRDPVFPQD
ncbi:MAG: pseudaminic acid biosynthesis-associated methylase, partial [Pseudomonadota bacterium]